MPPLFKLKLTIDNDFLDDLRELSPRAKRLFKSKINKDFRPELERDANAIMVPGPEPVSDPFQFGTAQSRKKYFAILRDNPDLSDGVHWIRTEDIETSFRVEVVDRIQSDLIRVINIHPKAKYLFGPWLVAGHLNTGWPEHADIAKQLLRERAVRRLAELWHESIAESMPKRRGA